MKLIYLACPYCHDDPKVEEQRVEKATYEAARLMAGGFNVFSPLTHSHHVTQHLPPEYAHDHDFWLSRDLQIIDKCDAVYVLCLDGWTESKGVAVEIKYAEDNGIPVRMLGGRR